MSEEIEIKLRHHIYNYIPKGWRENIGRVAFVAYYTSPEIEKFSKGIFPDNMPDYVREAVKDFLDKEQI